MKNKWLEQLKVTASLQADAEHMRLAKAYYRSELLDASLSKQVQHGEPVGLRLGKKDTEVARKVDPMPKAWIPAPLVWFEPESPQVRDATSRSI